MKIMICLLSLFFSELSFAYNYKPDVRQVRREISRMDQMEMANRTDKSLGLIIKLAASQLRKKGENAKADQLESEWSKKFQGFLPRMIQGRVLGQVDLGDHKPLSDWLAKWYDTLESILGPEVMDFLHLSDIKVFNYGIPVVFHLPGIDDIDAVEYSKHWIPFWGVVGYWTTWSGCEAVTFGSGWFIVCTPAGMVVEFVVKKYVAPKFSDSGYNFFYKSDITRVSYPVPDNLGCLLEGVLDLCAQ